MKLSETKPLLLKAYPRMGFFISFGYLLVVNLLSLRPLKTKGIEKPMNCSERKDWICI